LGLILPGDPDPTDEIIIIWTLKKVWDGCKWVYRWVKAKVRKGSKKADGPEQSDKHRPDRRPLEKEREHLRQVERELREQLDNGRRQAEREIREGRTPNPYGLGREINETLPNEINDVQNRLNEINRLLNK
jgi:hypothetical protein